MDVFEKSKLLARPGYLGKGFGATLPAVYPINAVTNHGDKAAERWSFR